MSNSKSKFNFIQILLFLASVAYPFFIYWSLTKAKLNILVAVLIGFSLFKLYQSYRTKEQSLMNYVQPVSLFVLSMLFYVFQDPKYIQFYPLVINLCFLFWFGLSLLEEETLVGKFARLSGESRTPRLDAYTRKVTQVWTMFFFLNSFIVIYTVYLDDLEFWTLYNGFISYLIIGLIFLTEFSIRTYLKAQWRKRDV